MADTIHVFTDDQKYQYDIHSLFKAFFPKEDVKIFCSRAEVSEGEKDPGSCAAMYRITTAGGRVSFEILKTDELTGEKKQEYRDESPETPADFDDPHGAQYRSIIKRLIYRNLRKKTDIRLPWGTLTGIRPVKLFMKGLEDGLSDEDIKARIRDEYLVSDTRLELGLSIAKTEKKILDPFLHRNGYSLYLGIPFCPTTCLYCSFTSYPISAYGNLADAYIKALKKEIDYVAEESEKNRMISDTVYIGGGTPTTLSPKQLSDLLSYLRNKLDLSGVKEFTLEAGRPDSITREKLEAAKEQGVSRISINPQTMNEKTLKVIGRAHTVKQVYEAFDIARKAGFDNINTDLIIGLPGEDIKDLIHTLERIRELSPESVTVHSMALKRAAGMHEFLKNNPGIQSLNTPEMTEEADRRIREMGLLPYYLYRQKNMAGNLENIGYAKEGRYGLYNVLIMEETESIIALGAGTVTKRVYRDTEGRRTGRIERCDAVKDVRLYIEKTDEMIERKKRLFAD
ncbi:MAG: coproporphyrinogen dehydrogenase HemZ [Lachnospiraceae bacterium]|nr:coproporphyrinogen dehydrogenase HemZ [Lachnospiraceae bacterium]